MSRREINRLNSQPLVNCTSRSLYSCQFEDGLHRGGTEKYEYSCRRCRNNCLFITCKTTNYFDRCVYQLQIFHLESDLLLFLHFSKVHGRALSTSNSREKLQKLWYPGSVCPKVKMCKFPKGFSTFAMQISLITIFCV